jgi:hypothetical protein
MTEPSSDFNPIPPSAGSFHQQVQHQTVTARLPAHLGRGVFANATVVLCGQHEVVVDFLICVGKPEQLTARVVLPVAVAERFVMALQESLHKFQQQFGPRDPETGQPAPLPHPPAASQASGAVTGTEKVNPSGPVPVQSANANSVENTAAAEEHPRPSGPGINELYGEIKIDDALVGGVYANVVLIRHTATEFCFDFVSSIYPRSVVTARVFMPSPHVQPLLSSLINSIQQHYRRPPTT